MCTDYGFYGGNLTNKKMGEEKTLTKIYVSR